MGYCKQDISSSENEINVLHDNNSSNFTLVDFGDFDLHEIETINVGSMNDEEDVHGVDDFIIDNEV